MKRLVKYLLIILILLGMSSTDVYSAANKVAWASGYTGGTAGKLDRINGSLLIAGTAGRVIDVSDNSVAFFVVKTSSCSTESTPWTTNETIIPDRNPGTKCWELVKKVWGLAVTGNITVTGTVDGVDIAAHTASVSSHHVATVSGDIDHDSITGVSVDDHHAQSHTVVSHSDTTATGAELETLTDTSDASSLHNHTTANLNDTTATGANLNTLTDDSMADLIHRHSELSASDGTPNPALSSGVDGDITVASGQLFMPDGSNGAPSYSFSNDSDTGGGRAAADQYSQIAGGVEGTRLTEASRTIETTTTVCVSGTDNVNTTAAHALIVDDVMQFTAGTVCTGTALNTNYYVQSITDVNNFKIALTRGGSAIDITGDGASLTTVELEITYNVYGSVDIGSLNGIILGTSGVLSAITDNSSNWDAAYIHIGEDGSSHTYIDQDVTSGVNPTFTADNFSDGGSNAIVTTTQETNWDAHLSDNTQAHSDYLLNTGDNSTGDYFYTGDINLVNDKAVLFQNAAANAYTVGIKSDTSDRMTFRIGSNWDRMVIDTSGQVGIGTNAPGAKLDVRGAAIFNEFGADVDFRVEGVGTPNALFVQGSDGFIGIGTDTPSVVLHVTPAINVPVSLFTSSKTSGSFFNNFFINFLIDDDNVTSNPLLVTSKHTSVTASTGNMTGMNLTTALQYQGTVTSIKSVLNQVSIKTSANGYTVTDAIGNDIVLSVGNSGTGGSGTVLTNYYGARLSSSHHVSANSALQGTNWYQIYVNDFVDHSNGTGTVGTMAGMWIDKMGVGYGATGIVTNSYGIVLAGDGAGSDIVLGDSQDSFIRYENTKGLVFSETTDNAFEYRVNTDTDVTMNFIGTTNSGVLKWMEDEDYFEFIDNVKITGTLESTSTVTATGYICSNCITGDSVNSNIAGNYITWTAASPDTFTLDNEITNKIANGGIIEVTTADDGFIQIKFATAITITRLSCSTSASTIDIQFDERAEATPNSGGTDIMASALQCDSTNGGITASFTNASIAADALLNLDIDAVGAGTPDLRFHVEYTIDD